MPQVRACVSEVEGRLEQVAPRYLQPLREQWATLEARGRADPDGKLSKQYVVGLRAFIDRQGQARVAVPAKPYE
eukprot:15299662-Heterocapsa_arctica.AAC.1